MSEYRSYRRQPRQSTKALTAKIAMLASVATLAIGGLIAAQMAAGSDPSLGPKAASRANKGSTSKSSRDYSSGYPSGSSGYSSDSDGYSSGSSGYSYSPPPVTSSTS